MKGDGEVEPGVTCPFQARSLLEASEGKTTNVTRLRMSRGRPNIVESGPAVVGAKGRRVEAERSEEEDRHAINTST